MPRVPFVGRLHGREYFALMVSFILIGLELFVRVITIALPKSVIQFFYAGSRQLFNYLSSPQGRRSRSEKKEIVNSIARASDFRELCELFGYYSEEHLVQTGDGYLLGLHRLGWKRGESDVKVNSGPGSVQKPVVYLHHGLLMNSDVWVSLTEKERSLAFTLVDQGYDVWLGNNRGNKYSKKSIHHGPNSREFWNFSIDQFAFYDIPNSIDYILATTGQLSLSYVGFSQGTAQAFATLSIHPNLNDKINVFVALAPAMSPSGLSHGIVDSFIKTSPEVLFLAFGRRSILSSTVMWQAILFPPIYIRVIDFSLRFLFGWNCSNISAHQKLAAYPHLYSFTSTKSVVHWFQIMRNGVFQMYDDEVQAPLSLRPGRKYRTVPTFPTRNIKSPTVLVYGGSDSLVDINIMLKELPRHTTAIEIPHYEHLDFLWAKDVDQVVFPHVLKALETYSHTVCERDVDVQHNSPDQTHKFTKIVLGDEKSTARSTLTKTDENQEYTSDEKSKQETGTPKSREITRDRRTSPRASNATPTRQSRARLISTSLTSEAKSHSPAASGSHVTEMSSSSRPEGWWSSDEVDGTDPSTPPRSPAMDRQSSTVIRPASAAVSSLGAPDSTVKVSSSGISIGASQAVCDATDRDALGSGTGAGLARAEGAAVAASAGVGKSRKRGKRLA